MIHMQTYKKSFHLITVFAHYLSQRCLWKRRGEAQLIGNIWVIVGSTPTSSNAGRDLTVPSEVTALTSAGAQACSCQGALGLEKRTEPGAPGTGWCRGFWWELCWQPTFESSWIATSLLMPSVVRRHRTVLWVFFGGGRMCVVWNHAATCYFKAMQRDPFKDFNNAKHNHVSLFSPPTTRWVQMQLLMLACTDVSEKRRKKPKPVGTIPF